MQCHFSNKLFSKTAYYFYNGLFLFFSLVVNLDIFKKDLTKYQYKPTTGECDRWMNSSPFLIFIGWLFRERGDCSVTRWGDFWKFLMQILLLKEVKMMLQLFGLLFI